MYKTIIFDFFEVIHQDPLEMLLSQKGNKRREGPFAEVCAQLDLGLIGYGAYVERLAELVEEAPEGFLKRFEALATVHPGMPELISELKTNYRTALLSNTTDEEISPLLERHSLRDLFDEIIISADVGLKKPDPEIFHLTLERLDTKPEEAIFIDDNAGNVLAAASLGIVGLQYSGVAPLRQELKWMGVIS